MGALGIVEDGARGTSVGSILDGEATTGRAIFTALIEADLREDGVRGVLDTLAGIEGDNTNLVVGALSIEEDGALSTLDTQ